MPDPALRPPKLTARSAVLSALLGAHPAEATAAGILKVAIHLGFQESAVRVALTRMVAAGDLERTQGVYRLSGRLITRQRRQDAALTPSLTAWDGHWSTIVFLSPADARTRAASRVELSELHLAELREGVWLRPDNLAIPISPDLLSRAMRFSSTPDGDATALAARLFNPAGWAADAESLLRAAAEAETFRSRFEAAAASVRHILHDPLLPGDLLPTDWPGGRLRDSYIGFRGEFSRFATDILETEK